MPRLAKVMIPKTVVFVTTSVEEGLPFVAAAYMHVLLESAMARAQKLHPIVICAYLIEASHAHFMFVVHEPDDIKGFMARFKTESAHAVNRLLGRKKRTIWCEGYDSPILVTPEDIKEKLIYLYTNPAKDGLESSVARYPGVSSWEAFRTGVIAKDCPRIRRNFIEKLANTKMTVAEQKVLAEDLVSQAEEQHPLIVRSNAWMDCFGGYEREEAERFNESLAARITEVEHEYALDREKRGVKVLGAEALIHQPMDKAYQPDRTGKRSWCICHDLTLRIILITWIKDLVARGRAVYRGWKNFDFSLRYPVGLFPPAMPRSANLVPGVAC